MIMTTATPVSGVVMMGLMVFRVGVWRSGLCASSGVRVRLKSKGTGVGSRFGDQAWCIMHPQV